MKEVNCFTTIDFFRQNGGEGEIRTLAPVTRSTPLAGAPLEPTWVLLRIGWINIKLAEREGFEPPAPCGVTGFQDQLHKPLGHLSISPVFRAGTYTV